MTKNVVVGITSLITALLSVTLMGRTRVVVGMDGVVTQLGTVLVLTVSTTV